MQKFSPNPKNQQYGLHCKFQLLRFKPWKDHFSDCLGDMQWEEDENDNSCWIVAWKEFLESEIGRQKVPKWEANLNNAKIAVENFPNDLENQLLIDEDPSRSQDHQIDWQKNQFQPLNERIDDINTRQLCEYWNKHRVFFENNGTDLGNIDDWITYEKSNDTSPPPQRPIVPKSALNSQQLKVFNIIEKSFHNTEKQLLLRVEGTAGTGITIGQINFFEIF